MKLKLWQVDAFADKPLEGNPAAIVPLESWLDARLMQSIADENNLAETAFFVQTRAGAYDLRWFTPNAEVDLCGHATLASACVDFRLSRPGLERGALSDALRQTDGDARRDGRQHHGPARRPRPMPFTPPAGCAQRSAQALGAPPPTEIA